MGVGDLKRIEGWESAVIELDHQRIVEALGYAWEDGWRIQRIWYTEEGPVQDDGRIRVRIGRKT